LTALAHEYYQKWHENEIAASTLIGQVCERGIAIKQFDSEAVLMLLDTV